jgi:ABC-type sugar transport system permease subunit
VSITVWTVIAVISVVALVIIIKVMILAFIVKRHDEEVDDAVKSRREREE